MNNELKSYENMLKMMIVYINPLTEEIIEEKAKEIHNMPSFKELAIEDVEEVLKSIKSQFSIKLDIGGFIEESGHEKWFVNRKSKLEMLYWERYKTYLTSDKDFSNNVVNKMDDILDTLTDLLGDPTRDCYKRRGLVIGDVQSGKTANYLGLICKAVDTGYKVIVLMTGTIEKLRKQTQQRVDEGFVGSDSDAMIKMDEKGQIIGVGKFNSEIRPMVLTSLSDDFKQKNAKNLNFNLRNIQGPLIVVVKKNVSILKRLNKWFKTFNRGYEKKINNPILIVDDESDYASVNTNKEDDDPTAINTQIREMLSSFDKSSYIGYTATPFANIFIDPDTKEEMETEDLFPKDYIYSLNAPSNYIGARDIFLEDGEKHFMLEPINDDVMNPGSIEAILPLKHKKDAFVNILPNDMQEAINSFVLANVVEDIRGLKNNHRSMMINVSRFTDVQNELGDCVNGYLKNIQSACKIYGESSVDSALKNNYIAQLKKTYEKIYGEIEINWEEIQKSLYESSGGIKVAVINQKSKKKLDYEEYKDGLRVIAIGGLTLSRGLTLEGLVISYYYRNSMMYDTLMQMGRWFGYRGKYDDLCRVWMSNSSIEWYKHISIATDELREEVKRYEDTGLTPLDFGLRVRSDINSLIVTARNKMRSATSMERVISLSGECIETPEIYSDEKKNANNITSIKKLIKDIEKSGQDLILDKKRYGYKNIPQNLIFDFLETFDVSPKNEKFNTNSIVKFIKNYKGTELDKWDIAFVTGESKNPVELSPKIKYNHPVRKYSIENGGRILKMSGSKKRLGTNSDGKFGLSDDQILKVKSECSLPNPNQKDYFNNVIRNPLLLIYVVGLKECVKFENIDDEKRIKSSFANNPVAGLGVGFPSLGDTETKYAKFVFNKKAMKQIIEDDLDIEEYEDED